MQRKSLRLLAGAGAIAVLLLAGGCSFANLTTMNPVGPVGVTERNITLITIVLMLFVLIPIVAGTIFIAWRYRSTSSDSAYTPDWDHSWVVELFCWGGPIVILIILAVITWISTHDLDPYRPLEAAGDKPLRIDAVATDWKWLFIYPDQHVASVNEFAFPINQPLAIHLTSNSVMNSFMVQRMGTQIFAMSGMQTQLHLMSHVVGNFDGGNYQYNGDGFAKMRFVAKAMTKADFKHWLAKARRQGGSLDLAGFKKFARPSVVKQPVYFAPVSGDLFADIIGQFHAPKGSAMPARLEQTAAR